MGQRFAWRRTLASIGAAAIVAAAFATAARAQARGPMTLAIGSAAGGGYDQYARLTARYLQRDLPGNPTIVAKNMTGAGGILVLNWMYNSAPRDGTAIASTQGSSVFAPLQGMAGAQYDPREFNWLISLGDLKNMLIAWHTSPVRTIEDVFDKGMALGNVAGDSSIVPAMLNRLLGTKFKIITGYAGGNDINLAMERGEVGARNNTWSSWKATKPDWLRDKLITVIAQAGPPATDLKAPSVLDLAKSDEERQLIALIVSGTLMGRPLATTPGTPPERVAALRAAFDATMQDPDFRAETTTAGFEIDPVSGLALQKVVADVLKTPKPIAMRAKQFLE
jgi:tripartite-type tricarboxylate transporter receptor subunit TctC